MNKTLKIILTISGIGIIVVLVVFILRKKSEAKAISPTVATSETETLPPQLALQVLPTYLADFLEKQQQSITQELTREQKLKMYVDSIVAGQRPSLITSEVYKMLPSDIQQLYGAIYKYPETPYALIGQKTIYPQPEGII